MGLKEIFRVRRINTRQWSWFVSKLLRCMKHGIINISKHLSKEIKERKEVQNRIISFTVKSKIY